MPKAGSAPLRVRRGNPKPKRKANNQRPGRKGFLSFIVSPVGRRLILVVVIIGLLYWFTPRLINLGVAAWQSSLELFGAGLGI
jgi:hypothetical protein